MSASQVCLFTWLQDFKAGALGSCLNLFWLQVLRNGTERGSQSLLMCICFPLLGKDTPPLSQTYGLSLLRRFTGHWHSVMRQKPPLRSVHSMEREQKWDCAHAQALNPVQGAWETWKVMKPSATALLKGGMWPWPSKRSLHKGESNLQCPVICWCCNMFSLGKRLCWR